MAMVTYVLASAAASKSERPEASCAVSAEEKAQPVPMNAAVNGKSGLNWLADNPAPSLILLDLMMPEMDGFEFLRELRKQPAFVDVPVIVVTAKELTAEDVRILSGQTERIIPKDQAYLAELAAAVRGRLAGRPAREPERVAN